ncbi:TRAP transporter large permease [uncultured Albimonas sp.]|uniref:TRAP transporter large permease n=1 Tax=uncultured Albimonas sp. TaxID=1331701 RepID=UPI0030ED5644|tara:strand:- start:5366 stop:6661 length:1296 start_codon:yes stop_codon:yes gene_type:complete
MTVALLGFLAAFVLIFARVPVAVALMSVGTAGIWMTYGAKMALASMALVVKETTLAYTLTVIPLFILMGAAVARGGLAEELYDAARALVGRFRGGLAFATILSCGGFAAVSGSSVATAVTLSRIAVPEMRRRGYSDALATGAVAAGGTLGILIPPSVIMVVYGITTETPIGELFAAGMIPGLLGILGYCLAIAWIVMRRPASAPPGESVPWREVRAALGRVWAVLLLFVVVIGGIYGGLFTPTEAAGIGAACSLLIVASRGDLTLRTLWEIMVSTAEVTAAIFAILIGATVFAEFLNFSGAHEGVLAVVRDAGLPPWAVIAAILGIYLVMGCVLESLSMMLLTVPLFFPIVTGLGFDPVWFGIVVVMAVEIGLITPPLGMNLFVMRTVVRDVPLWTLYRGVAPFVAADVLRLILLAAIPGISLLLPELLFR